MPHLFPVHPHHLLPAPPPLQIGDIVTIVGRARLVPTSTVDAVTAGPSPAAWTASCTSAPAAASTVVQVTASTCTARSSLLAWRSLHYQQQAVALSHRSAATNAQPPEISQQAKVMRDQECLILGLSFLNHAFSSSS